MGGVVGVGCGASDDPDTRKMQVSHLAFFLRLGETALGRLPAFSVCLDLEYVGKQTYIQKGK